MVLTEYNEKQVMNDLKKEAYDDGFNNGRQEEIENTIKERQRANIAEKGLAEAKEYIKELEEKLANLNSK